MDNIKGMIGDLIRQFGISFILKEVSDYLTRSQDENERVLGRDIDEAVRKFERRKK